MKNNSSASLHPLRLAVHYVEIPTMPPFDFESTFYVDRLLESHIYGDLWERLTSAVYGKVSCGKLFVHFGVQGP